MNAVNEIQIFGASSNMVLRRPRLSQSPVAFSANRRWQLAVKNAAGH